MSDNAELIQHLRKAFCGPDDPISDEQLLRVTEGIGLRKRIEFDIAITRLKVAIRTELMKSPLVRWLFDE